MGRRSLPMATLPAVGTVAVSSLSRVWDLPTNQPTTTKPVLRAGFGTSHDRIQGNFPNFDQVQLNWWMNPPSGSTPGQLVFPTRGSADCGADQL